jgi:hypothetical protein
MPNVRWRTDAAFQSCTVVDGPQAIARYGDVSQSAVGSSEQAVLRLGSHEPDRRLARRRYETPEYP